MNLEKQQHHIDSSSTAELAMELKEKMQQYRSASLEPDATQSIPNLDLMCAIAAELANRLNDSSN